MVASRIKEVLELKRGKFLFCLIMAWVDYFKIMKQKEKLKPLCLLKEVLLSVVYQQWWIYYEQLACHTVFPVPSECTESSSLWLHWANLLMFKKDGHWKPWYHSEAKNLGGSSRRLTACLLKLHFYEVQGTGCWCCCFGQPYLGTPDTTFNSVVAQTVAQSHINESDSCELLEMGLSWTWYYKACNCPVTIATPES